MLGTVLSRGAARGLGFAKLVSVGNEADLGVGELVELLADDPDTRVILLFLETVRDAARLAAAARKAHAAGKPVVAYKLGRSALGEALARSHTGALAGCRRGARRLLPRLRNPAGRHARDADRDRAAAVAGRPPAVSRARRASPSSPPPAAARRAWWTASACSASKRRRPTRRCGHSSRRSVRVSDSPIVDLTMAGTSETYGAIARGAARLAGLRRGARRGRVLGAVPSAARGRAHPPGQKRAKPLAVFLTPHAERSLALLAAKGIAAFRTPEACADAFAAYLRLASPRKQPASAAVEWPEDVPQRGKLDEAQAFALFGALGVPVVESARRERPTSRTRSPIRSRRRVRRPISPTRPRVGGVALGIATAASTTSG